MINLKLLIAAAVAMAAVPTSGVAQATVFGLQPATGQILEINPLTGAVTGSYATPAAISTTSTHAGLSYAAPLNQLLYIDPAVSGTMYRLDPDTGLTQATNFGDTFANSGLSFEQDSTGQNFLYYAHQSSDIHRQAGLAGSEAFFWATGAPSGGLAGDGYGREFGIFSDGQIHEYDPFVDTDTFIGGFASITGAIGLAFDGVDLYVSTNQGQLVTVDPNTGAVIRTVNVAGGNLIELGARAPVPEPTSLAACLTLGGLGAAGWARRRKSRGV